MSVNELRTRIVQELTYKQNLVSPELVSMDDFALAMARALVDFFGEDFDFGGGGGGGGDPGASLEELLKRASKQPVRAVSAIEDINLFGLQLIDGVSVSEDDRVLVTAQDSPAENGIYIASAGLWLRSDDAKHNTLFSAAFTFVEEGNVYNNTGWMLSNPNQISVGSTEQEWIKFTGESGVYREYVGDGETEEIIVVHNLGQRFVQVSVWEADEPYSLIYCVVHAESENEVKLSFTSPPGENQYVCVICG